MNILQGKVSYILAGLAVVYGIAGYLTGHLQFGEAETAVWGGLAVFGLRRAIANQQ